MIYKKLLLAFCFFLPALLWSYPLKAETTSFSATCSIGPGDVPVKIFTKGTTGSGNWQPLKKFPSGLVKLVIRPQSVYFPSDSPDIISLLGVEKESGKNNLICLRAGSGQKESTARQNLKSSLERVWRKDSGDLEVRLNQSLRKQNRHFRLVIKNQKKNEGPLLVYSSNFRIPGFSYLSAELEDNGLCSPIPGAAPQGQTRLVSAQAHFRLENSIGGFRLCEGQTDSFSINKQTYKIYIEKSRVVKWNPNLPREGAGALLWYLIVKE